MSMFNEDGDLINYSDGENPNATYEVQWDNVKKIEDIKDLLKPIMTYMYANLSTISREEAIKLSTLLDKKLIK